LVRQDINRRLVTVEGAKRYGVVIAADGSVDNSATEALRAKLKAAAGEPGLFNFGGDVEEIRSRCEQETNLPAPVKPTFIGASR
jgi:N-methylhydantoinase B